MRIPTKNLDAMIKFLTNVSETSGDHFMQAADMLRAQQAHIAELESPGTSPNKLIQLRSAVEEMQGAAYLSGETSLQAVELAFDAVIDKIDELLKGD